MATAENEIYDATLLGILQKEGQIYPLQCFTLV